MKNPNNCPMCPPDKCGPFRKVVIPASLGGSDGEYAPKNGDYQNALVEYLADGTVYIYSSDGIPTKVPSGDGTRIFDELEGRPKYDGRVMTSETDIPSVEELRSDMNAGLRDANNAIGLVVDDVVTVSNDLRTETVNRQLADGDLRDADANLQSQIDALSAASDVTDIVGTEAELEAYDTSKLKDNDIIKVLQDETENDATTYYRWSTTTQTFTLIGEEGPYYTKTQTDSLLDGKQDKLTAGTNISIDQVGDDLVISAAGGDSETIFYANLNETGTTRYIYKDIAFTTKATAQDIINANDDGQVILRGTSSVNPTAYNDAYLQNAFIMPHNNDFEFVFLDRDVWYEYSVTNVTDDAFYYTTSSIQPRLNAGSNITITGTTISATDTTYSEFTGAGAAADGTSGLVTKPLAGDNTKYLKGDGSWDTPTDTTYSNFVGTDGQTAGAAGLVPAPATADAGKFLKADGTWDTAGSSATLYSGTGQNTDGAMTQKAVTDTLFNNNNTSRVQIGSGATCSNNSGVAVGSAASVSGQYGTAVGGGAMAGNSATALGKNARATSGIHIGNNSSNQTKYTNDGVTVGNSVDNRAISCVALGNETGFSSLSRRFCVALGSKAQCTRDGEVNIGTGSTTDGFNSSSYRVIGGVYDGQTDHDAATVGQLNAKAVGTTESYTIATSDWTALAGNAPYTYSATVTSTYSSGANTLVHLYNDQPAAFATYGFAVASASGTTVTIYSIGQPDSSVTLSINYKETA